MIQCQLSLNWLQLLVAVITLLNNLVSDEDVRLTVIKLLSRNRRKDLQVGKRLLCTCMARCTSVLVYSYCISCYASRTASSDGCGLSLLYNCVILACRWRRLDWNNALSWPGCQGTPGTMHGSC
jgi:hypothetical protein